MTAGLPAAARARTGCLWVAAGGAALLVVVAVLMVTAHVHNRDVRPERHVEQRNITAGSSLSIEVDVRVAQLTVFPAPPGAPARVEARFDSADYAWIDERADGAEAGPTWRVGLRPRGSAAWALLRGKLGGPLPVLRLELPPGVTIHLRGTVDRGFAAMELGGLTIDAADLEVRAGGASISFAEPLTRPMEHLRIHGDKGSIEVTTLGNASPRRVEIGQNLGALDLDLRGPWQHDADVLVEAWAAGGTIWLPRGIEVIGAGPGRPAPEVPGPRLNLMLPPGRRNLILID